MMLAKVIFVIALIGVAGALATPPGRLPLALRGVMRIMRRDRGLSEQPPADAVAPTWKRMLAFILVVLAAVLALIR